MLYSYFPFVYAEFVCSIGVMETRLRGYEEASGEVVVFLDAHVEVNVGWLQPLCEQLMNHPESVSSENKSIDGKSYTNDLRFVGEHRNSVIRFPSRPFAYIK